MMKHFDCFVRRSALILSAGMLLQVGACNVDATTGAVTLLGLVLQRLIGGVVFGAFNLATVGF